MTYRHCEARSDVAILLEDEFESRTNINQLDSAGHCAKSFIGKSTNSYKRLADQR
ncbi:hypothetical protein OQZ33_14170 [Pedobacter sp. MC2016-05]|nr:hypothetical protein [Pedobacter sp. MC2016-05]